MKLNVIMRLCSVQEVDGTLLKLRLMKSAISIPLVVFMAANLPDTAVTQWKVVVCVGPSCQMRFSGLPTHRNLYPSTYCLTFCSQLSIVAAQRFYGSHSHRRRVFKQYCQREVRHVSGQTKHRFPHYVICLKKPWHTCKRHIQNGYVRHDLKHRLSSKLFKCY